MVKEEVLVLRQLLKGFSDQDSEPRGLQSDRELKGGGVVKGPWGSG